MSDVRIKIGGEFFRKIRQSSCYYVDKTCLIEELLCGESPKVSLITRPRRFGKTLMMTMLRDFFDISHDSKAIFDGLAISKNQALCDMWMNKYPVVFITFKRTGGRSFEDALEKIRSRMSDVCHVFAFLINSPTVDETDREDLRTLKAKKGDKVLLLDSLKILCRALHAHYGKPVILLIDEYDVPLARAQENGYYHEMEEWMRTMLKETFQNNEFLQFAILTGCLRISKESIFTEIASFRCYDVTEARFADKYGFTPGEVDDLLACAGCSAKKGEVKELYDGYRFGDDTEIYCPWDILNYVSVLQSDIEAKPKSYWGDTSGNDVIHNLVGHADIGIVEKVETLLSGGYITANRTDTLTHDTLYDSEDSLWALLWQTGYLTKTGPAYVGKREPSATPGKVRLVIPNKEIRTIFIRTIKSWFDDSMQAMDRKPLFDAFWNGDSKNFQEIFSDILLTTISYNDYHENFYHAVLTGLFVGSGCKAKSNDESGLGRADIIVKGPNKSKAAIIEVKHTKDLEELTEKAEEALSQIKKKKYAATVKGYRKVIFWGISFCDKSCAALAEDAKKLPL